MAAQNSGYRGSLVLLGLGVMVSYLLEKCFGLGADLPAEGAARGDEQV